jgi:DNA-binding NarL/FixJ family response regulator
MKVLVVDDHALIREALRGVLKKVKGQATVLEAPDSSQAIRQIDQNPDLTLILLDLNLPDRNGFEVLADLRNRYPAISIVVLSGFNDRANVVRALDLGAMGFIPKTAQREVMVNALRLVLSGGIYIPPDILARAEVGTASSLAAQKRPASPGELGLSERQLQVLALVMQGKSNKAICRVLDLAEPTVKSHVTAILKALDVTNRTEAVIAVSALGWDLPRVPEH